MPMIDTKVSVTLSKETEQRLKAQFGEAIALLPGKSEQWLMLNFQDNARLWFRGEQDAPIAYLEVKVFGQLNPAACDKLTARLTEIMEKELAIPGDHVYVKYEAVTQWGWNGNNF